MYNSHKGMIMENFAETREFLVCGKRIRQGLWALLCVITVVSLIAVGLLQFIWISPYRTAAISVFWNVPAYGQQGKLHRVGWHKVILKNETSFCFYVGKMGGRCPFPYIRMTIPRKWYCSRCPCCQH